MNTNAMSLNNSQSSDKRLPFKGSSYHFGRSQGSYGEDGQIQESEWASSVVWSFFLFGFFQVFNHLSTRSISSI